MDALYDRSTLRAFLERHGLWARKALAQHFLCSKPAVQAILARTAGFQGVLEIGPGPGVLTSALSEATARVIALEVDAGMLPALAESAPRAEVRLQDALEADLSAILGELQRPKAVVSNMPYHITGPLITRIASVRHEYDKAVLMMQREVADRIMAPPGDSNRGSLSVFLEAQFEAVRVCNVPAGAFFPPPKVDSAVLEFIPKAGAFPAEEEGRFLRLVRSGFKMPRKTLANNLSASVPREAVSAAIEEAGLGASVRPHMMSLEEWKELWQRLEERR